VHVLFLTDNFPPEVNAPSSRTFEHCREWVRSGVQVTVITCAPNFPHGKIFDGYRNRLWQTETVEGIKVIRVWTYVTSNEGFLRRTLDYLSFMVASFIAAMFVRNVDVIVGTSPQFFTACAAYLTSVFKRKPWVFELRDIWPESIRAVGAMTNSKALVLLEKMELFLYRRASLIVSVTHSFKENLIQRGIEENKIEVITNGVDSSLFSPREKDQRLVEQYNLQGKQVVGYIGTHGLAHSLETLLQAAKLIEGMPGGDDYRFILLGDGARKQSLQAKAEQEKIQNVIFVSSVSKEDVVRYWSLLDVAVIHLKKNELFKTVIPSKLFECMGMGIPVAHGVAGESAAIVETEGVGLCFEPENAPALCETIYALTKNEDVHRGFQLAGPNAVGRYNRGMLASRMRVALERVSAAERTRGV
jgi:glycosyltransferase involved in cell wall biosynthesis